jgi:hypothetical protein
MSNRHDIFTKRGITPPWKPGGHVARAQGFARYEGADWEERRAAIAAHAWQFDPLSCYLPQYDEKEGPRSEYAVPRARRRDPERAWEDWLRTYLTVDGWLMPRHATMTRGDFSAQPMAQLRPDEAVPRRPTWHRHRGLPCEARTAHEAKLCDLDADGNVIPTGHLHPRTGEIVVPLEGWHEHPNPAKYLYTPGSSARRLGTSPLSRDSGYEADQLFVAVMEGTLKMCAVTEAGYPCIDAGSVTLWRSERRWEEFDEDAEYMARGAVLELEHFAGRHLHGRKVAVVCDSDWHSNPAVLTQTEQVAAILREQGAEAIACAPPEGKSYGWHHPITGREMRAKLGVDDWLGQNKPGDRHAALRELVFYERVADVTLTLDDPRWEGIRRDGARTALDVTLALGATATPDGLAVYRRDALVTTLGRRKSRVEHGYARAVERGLLRPLSRAEQRRDLDGAYYTVPALVRVDPAAVPATVERTLRDWL